jgi:hypothetical protein
MIRGAAVDVARASIRVADAPRSGLLQVDGQRERPPLFTGASTPARLPQPSLHRPSGHSPTTRNPAFWESPFRT